MCRSPTYCDTISALPECSVNSMLWAFSLQNKTKEKESKFPSNRAFSALFDDVRYN